MARKDVFVCDECGKVKDSVNHWWRLDGPREDEPGLIIEPWPNHPIDGRFDCCGQSCVIAAVNRFMSSGKLEK